MNRCPDPTNNIPHKSTWEQKCYMAEARAGRYLNLLRQRIAECKRLEARVRELER
jgi:hypothetical protein